LTEYGEIEQTGEMEWQAALNSNRRLIGALNDGANAALVWDAYDNFHGHDDCWTIWGIMRFGYGVYTPKVRYHGARHVYRLVPPGAKRVDLVAEGTPLVLTAFQNPSGSFTVTGINESDNRVTTHLVIEGGEIDRGPIQIHVTEPGCRFERIACFPSSRRFEVAIPANSIFSISTHPIEIPHRGIAPSTHLNELGWIPASALSAAQREISGSRY
jgi:hypothetical protein